MSGLVSMFTVGGVDDPLLAARKSHYGRYLGSPDGRCCMGCEKSAEDEHRHQAWNTCPVINANRCEYEFGEWRCILSSGHDSPDRHLVENKWQSRMVVSPAEPP